MTIFFSVYVVQALAEGYIAGMIASLIVFLLTNYYARDYYARDHVHREGYSTSELVVSAILWPLAWAVLVFPERGSTEGG